MGTLPMVRVHTHFSAAEKAIAPAKVLRTAFARAIVCCGCAAKTRSAASHRQDAHATVGKFSSPGLLCHNASGCRDDRPSIYRSREYGRRRRYPLVAGV